MDGVHDRSEGDHPIGVFAPHIKAQGTPEAHEKASAWCYWFWNSLLKSCHESDSMRVP